jgi:flagellar biosynthesis protein FliR
VVLAVLARTAPQFNLFGVGMPLKIGVALVALATTATLMAPHLHEIFSLSMAAPLQVFR